MQQATAAIPIREWSKSIKGADDFELGIPRTTPLIYHCTAPEAGPAKGLVFVIPNFNDEVTDSDFVALRQHLAREHGLLAVSVEYHCYRSRLQDGAQLNISEEEFQNLGRLCASHGVALLDRNALISALKQLPVAYEFEFSVAPANGDYQNLGVMQALDHLAVLHDLHCDQVITIEDRTNVIAMGKGYGGYLANLLAKFAPNALRAVFSLDAFTSPPLSYLFGSKKGKAATEDAPYYYHVGKVRLFPIIKTRWVHDATAANGFSRAHIEIRNVGLPSHLRTMRLASRRRTVYRLAISTNGITPSADGFRNQTLVLKAAGFDAELITMTKSSPFELVKIFDDWYSSPHLADATPNQHSSSSVAYLSTLKLYCIDYDEFGCQLSILPIEPDPPRYSYAYY